MQQFYLSEQLEKVVPRHQALALWRMALREHLTAARERLLKLRGR
jgi:hypothetical protein